MTEETSLTKTTDALDKLEEGPEVLSETPMALGTNRLFHVEHFKTISSLSEMFARSTLVKPHFRGPRGSEGHSNTFIALSMAMEMDIPWLQALNHIHVVKGNVGFSGQLYLALANQRAPIKGRIMFKEKGTGDKLETTAWAIDKESGETVEYSMSIEEIKNTEWYSRNPLWKKQPKLMLRYRAGTYLVRTNFPEAMLGLQTQEELVDVYGPEEDVGQHQTAQNLQAKLIEGESEDA